MKLTLPLASTVSFGAGLLFCAAIALTSSEVSAAPKAAPTTVAAAAPAKQIPTDVDYGAQIWKSKAGCPFCHGWAANGQGDPHSEGAAPSLRDLTLTADQVRTIIQCGIPGSAMPHFDKFAYTDKRCYDSTAADLGNQVPNQPPVGLQPYEIQAVADYVAYKVEGSGPVTEEECQAYFGGPSTACSEYPKKASLAKKPQG